MDGWLQRDGAHWLVTRQQGVITTSRISTDHSQVVAARATWTDPAADGSDTHCSPLPDGALATSTRESGAATGSTMPRPASVRAGVI
ncbi:hypothetical protein [Streptomyces sp. NPDC055055]